MMQAVTARCADIVLESRWYGVPAKVLEVVAQPDTVRAPARRAAMRDHLAAKWGVPESELSIIPPPLRPLPDRYHETYTSQNPLNWVYWNLREFLRRGQLERLRKCQVCQRYFVQKTVRAQTYCQTQCRLKADITKEQNAANQRK
jgi:hypothetical protein